MTSHLWTGAQLWWVHRGSDGERDRTGFVPSPAGANQNKSPSENLSMCSTHLKPHRVKLGRKYILDSHPLIDRQTNQNCLSVLSQAQPCCQCVTWLPEVWGNTWDELPLSCMYFTFIHPCSEVMLSSKVTKRPDNVALFYIIYII